MSEVLVLGATGRIGRVLRAVWPEGRALWQTRDATAPGPGWVAGDPLAAPDALARAAAGVRTVLCLAGRVPGQGDMTANVALGLAAIDIAARAGAGRVLLASSAAVYGRGAGPLGEKAPLAPETDYGRAKVRMEEEAAARSAAAGVAVTALRIGNIAGIDTLLGQWAPGCELDCFADGRTPRRSYIGLETLAGLLGRLAALPDLPPVLNIAAPGVVEMGALLDAAGLGWTPRPAPAHAIPEVVLDLSLLQGICPLPARAGHPETLIAEWRALREAAA